MTAITGDLPRLHLPDEPTARAELWLDAVLSGQELVAVIAGEGGFVDWLWSRWRVLAASGLNRGDLEAVVVAYRREIWLWLAGERTWEQCCSGLLGRMERRFVAAPTA